MCETITKKMNFEKIFQKFVYLRNCITCEYNLYFRKISLIGLHEDAEEWKSREEIIRGFWHLNHVKIKIIHENYIIVN